jgi:hypothetical protein
MARVTIHVGGPSRPARPAFTDNPWQPNSTRLAVLVQLSTDAFTASRRNADREGRSVPEAIVSPQLSRRPLTPGQLAPQRRCLRAHAPIDGRTPVRKTAYTLSIVLGSILIIGGVATWIVVSTTLADQKIVVSDDASCLAGDEVDGPFSAYCEAMVIDKHALEATGGLRYAELDREDPKRQTAQTASFLQASLFTSVVAFGVAAMAIAVGVLFILIGLGIRDVTNRIRDLASRTPATA